MHPRLFLLHAMLLLVPAFTAAQQYYPPRSVNSSLIAMMSADTAPFHDSSTSSDALSAPPSNHDRGEDDNEDPPLILPATFDLIGANKDLTLKADGSFTVTCIPGKPCPVRPPTGRGEFLVNLGDNSILFFQMIDQEKQWVVRQTWVIGSKDLGSPVWSGNWLRAHHGDRSDEWPVPQAATVWKRRE